ncbi:MAG: hypothetical protein HOW97_14075 [Catenulispora sp.]|nr:hypothetical protein [Catenulispora sp.]
MRKSAFVAALTAAAALSIAVSAIPAAAAASTPQLPQLTVLTDTASAGKGDIFLTPTSADPQYLNGVEILSADAKHVVWSHPVPAGLLAADFREQTYHGRPVLTWWQGTGLGGLADGVDEIYDAHYRKIAEVRAGNGLKTDGHEFVITPRGTALILAYTEAEADLRSIGGPAHQKVIDGVVQEVDIATGKVLFQWDSADHVPYSQSEQPLPKSPDTPWDWFHINAVKQDGADLLINARNTWTAYEVSRATGKIEWQLGGKASSFTVRAEPGQELNTAGAAFAWQHDTTSLGHGYYSVFDNEAAGAANSGTGVSNAYDRSRVVTLKLDPAHHEATLISTEDQPAKLLASSQGNAQHERHGATFVGWGSLPFVSEFDGNGALVFNAQFPAGVNSYRAYRFDWSR